MMPVVNTVLREPMAPPSLLVRLCKPLTETLGLTTLPYHVHEICWGF